MRKDGKIIKRSGILSSGKTVEKALEKALAELNASIDEVEIEIVDAGQKGMLSIFGSRDAQIRVTRKAGAKGIEEAVDDVARTIMDCLDVNYRLFTKDEDDSTYINIETAGVDGLLIGRKGDTLNSLQNLIGRIVSKRMGGYQRLTVDVGGYLSNRREILKQKALKAAERAKKTGRDIPLEPMKAAERRLVHLALAEVDGITTYTIGNGEMRKVYVSTGRGDQGGNRYHNR
ncbi:MAG: Jag N-terminal domain-containing protein [Candidatus Krumholzibacteria bacterium]|nr:Jag N-terminal domain-containing protein [Candidatus Krumholzibacteria bacterium]